jgi:putative membrane protein
MLKTELTKAVLSAAIAAAVAMPFAAGAQTMNTPAAPALNKTDQQIVEGMARANMAEIDAGKLALANGQSAEVKAFAQQMIDDHGKALADVTTLAQNKGVTLPAEPDAKHKAMAAKLAKLKGAAFDKSYMAQAGVDDHKKVLAALKKDEARAKDPDVKALAAKMLPTVEQHLHTATGAPHAHAAK